MSRSDKTISGIIDALRRTFIALEGQPCSPGKGIDLTGRQVIALLLIGVQGSLTVSRLAALMSLKMAAVSGLLKRLEDLKLICRCHNIGDRRVVTLSLTQAGSRMARAISVRGRDFIAAMELNDASRLEAIQYSLECIVDILESQIGRKG